MPRLKESLLKENGEYPLPPAAKKRATFADLPTCADERNKRKKQEEPVEPRPASVSDDVGGYNAERAFRRGKRQRHALLTSSEASQRTYQRSITPESTPLSSSDSSSDSEISSDWSISNLDAFIVDSPDEESSATDDEDFEHDFEVIKKINVMKKQIGNLRKKLRTKAGVDVVADLSVPKTRKLYELVDELYGMVEKIVRPDVESVRNRVGKDWEPPQRMFRIKNVNILVNKGEYYAIPVMKEFQDEDFGHDVEITVLTENEQTDPFLLEAKHIRSGKCIDSRAFDVLEDLLEMLVEYHIGLKTFEEDEDVDEPDERAKLVKNAKQNFVYRTRNEIAGILPKAIWPKQLQDLFQGQRYGLLANPFNTRMVTIAEYLVMKLLDRLFVKHNETVLLHGFNSKKVANLVKMESKEIKKVMLKKVHGTRLDRWVKQVKEAVSQENESREASGESNLLPTPNMGSLRKTIIHWINEILRPELKAKKEEEKRKRKRGSGKKNVK